MNKKPATVTVHAVMLTILLIITAIADTEPLNIRGFRITHELTVPGDSVFVYDAITGDISGWWDHSFSGNPYKFYIEAHPGGGFYEIFDESGDGVKHATVIAAQRGKLLRFEGPLGLSGRAVHMIHTYEFSGRGQDSTLIKLTVNAMGNINQELADTVERVWYHFLFEQFKPYVTRQNARRE
jgi:hypothetical protein